jgi:hypothetical protein
MRRGRMRIHSVCYRKAPPLSGVRIYSVWKAKIDIDLRRRLMRMLFVKERTTRVREWDVEMTFYNVGSQGSEGETRLRLQHLSRLMIGGHAQASSDPMRAAEPATISTP